MVSWRRASPVQRAEGTGISQDAVWYLAFKPKKQVLKGVSKVRRPKTPPNIAGTARWTGLARLK